MRRRPDGRHDILFAPEALDRLAAGFDHLAALMALTLGPTQAAVLNARPGGSVELLSDAGTIARRVVEIPGRGQNTGAMILRHLAWRMHDQYGDGAATAAVLAREMVRAAVKRIEAGVDPALIRSGLEHALSAALPALATQAEPAAGQTMLTGVATGVTGDPELGAVLGEMADLLGPSGALTIEEYPIPYLDRAYVEGAYWRAHPAARSMIPEGQAEVGLDRPLILIVDQPLNAVDDILPALELASLPETRRPLLVVAANLGDHALQAIGLNQSRGTVDVIAASFGTMGPALSDDLGDLAVLTGGTVLANIAGRPPRALRPADLGTARKAVLSRDSLIVVGGTGDLGAIAARSSELQRRLVGLTAVDEERKRHQGRIARFGGGIGILKLGARVGMDLAHRRAQAEKAFRVLTGSLAGGVVPGGGVAYLGCVPAVAASRECHGLPGQEHGVDVLLAALEAPFRQIVRNHGLVHPPLALAEAMRRGHGHGLDVTSGEYVDLRERGILDSLYVVQGALQAATSAAISVLTTGVVILPPDSKRAHRVAP